MRPFPYIQKVGNGLKNGVISTLLEMEVSMQTKLTIPERLKDLRVEQGLTLEQLAEKTGLSAAALGRYEIDDGPKAARSVDISSYALCQLAEV